MYLHSFNPSLISTYIIPIPFSFLSSLAPGVSQLSPQLPKTSSTPSRLRESPAPSRYPELATRTLPTNNGLLPQKTQKDPLHTLKRHLQHPKPQRSNAIHLHHSPSRPLHLHRRSRVITHPFPRSSSRHHPRKPRPCTFPPPPLPLE